MHGLETPGFQAWMEWCSDMATLAFSQWHCNRESIAHPCQYGGCGAIGRGYLRRYERIYCYKCECSAEYMMAAKDLLGPCVVLTIVDQVDESTAAKVLDEVEPAVSQLAPLRSTRSVTDLRLE